MAGEEVIDLSERLYAGYDSWKGWVEPFMCSAELARYFAGEMRGRNLAEAEVLEIGFGNGEFLGWARSQGARISGSELTPGAINAAEKAGLSLYPANFETGAGLPPRHFDVIAAFDVFEHMVPEVIIAKLAAISAALKPGGWLVLRYPNGQSPFGLAPQNADATHLVALSRYKIEQYATGTELRTVHYGGVARSGSGSFAKDFLRRIRWILRDGHMALLRFLYATDAELEPVVTQILECTAVTPGDLNS